MSSERLALEPKVRDDGLMMDNQRSCGHLGDCCTSPGNTLTRPPATLSHADAGERITTAPVPMVEGRDEGESERIGPAINEQLYRGMFWMLGPFSPRLAKVSEGHLLPHEI
jgi:hypothetical protein